MAWTIRRLPTPAYGRVPLKHLPCFLAVGAIYVIVWTEPEQDRA